MLSAYLPVSRADGIRQIFQKIWEQKEIQKQMRAEATINISAIVQL